MTEPYNYPHFPLDLDGAAFAAFPDFLRVGAPAPGFRLRAVDDRTVSLYDPPGDRNALIVFLRHFG